ncbi:hypothetical protein [Cellulomonas sp. Leaf395]|uniref:hypothetical protein n=1 Tax=Cellulomonas sp. Leaf395 TaxID=1736362 RepID=UPI000ADB9101|nr:hypothetical protein [Cellulomonas sp. Leaf395]
MTRHLVDGDTGPAAELLQRAVGLDPGNEDTTALLRGLVARSRVMRGLLRT